MFHVYVFSEVKVAGTGSESQNGKMISTGTSSSVSPGRNIAGMAAGSDTGAGPEADPARIKEAKIDPKSAAKKRLGLSRLDIAFI